MRIQGKDIWPLTKETFSSWLEHKAPKLAAALATYAMLSLAPLLVIVTKIVGIYYMANACGRLAGTVLSGLLYQIGLRSGPNRGLIWCLLASTGFVLLAGLLSLGLPRLDGMEVCRRIRAESDVPILMLTARTETEDRVKGLDTGADDYLPKPFERTELLARIRALLRRRPPRGSASIVVGDLLINPDTREVKRGDREIELTNREFELLEYLARNQKLVVSRERLLEDVWGYDPFEQTNTIDVFISNLRRKLESGGEPRLLHTKRGAGYVLKAAA